ncbi:MAG: DUF4329 domain-containing protein [Treponema sp.]|nr:DUF4329 domain-containing protein [Treponema sp.]
MTRIVKQYDDARAQAAREAELARVETMRPKPLLENGGVSYYSSTDDAALAWAMEYNPKSVANGIEYGGLIYQSTLGYYCGPTSSGNAKSVNIWQGFDDDGYLAGDPIAGFVHTHGSYTNSGNANMSDIDITTGKPGDTGVVMNLNDWRKYHLDANGITNLDYLTSGFVANANGELQKLVITRDQYNAMGSHGAAITDRRYISIVSTGIPSANDKLVQEVVRMILASIFESSFSNRSHGFMPGKSCHTALTQIQDTFTGANWFVEGDIEACFDSFDHHVIIGLLRQRIEDEPFISLMWKFLKAGYMEQWEYHKTYDGVPQGSGISPILSNIYLSELDNLLLGIRYGR